MTRATAEEVAPADSGSTTEDPVPTTRSRRAPGRSAPWYVATPGIAWLLAFHIIPVAVGAWYAFTDWDGLSHATFVGLRNFREIFESADASTALLNSVKVGLAFVVVTNLLGLAIALALNRTLKSRYVLQALFFLPVLMSPLAVSYIWQYIFSNDGTFNEILHGIGLDSWARPWLGDKNWAIWCVLVVLVWQFTGLSMIIYLAGLQGISDELYEAAAIDDAGWWRQLRKITLPMLAPAITVSVALTLILGLRVFDQVLGLTDGGPVGASETLATQVYKQTFVFGRFGYGAALALVLTALVALVTIGQTLVLRRRELHG